MSYELLAQWIRQHGAEASVSRQGVSIGTYYSSPNEDGSFQMGIEWSKPVKTLRAAAQELGY
jgi:hypothetical protein